MASALVSRPERWLLGTVACGLLASKFRAAFAAGNDSLLQWHGLGDPYILRLAAAVGATAAIVAVLAALFALARRHRLAALTAFVVLALPTWWADGLSPDAVPLSAAAGSPRPALPVGPSLMVRGAYIAVSARRTGDVAAPASVVLHLRDGSEISALQGTLPADHQWHRLNLPAPSGVFSIEPRGQIEVRSAAEYSRGSRLAGKILSLWPILAGCGLVCLGFSGLAAVNPSSRRPWTQREGRLLPWLALLAWAGILIPFLDTYAGGSDSAGYLGSARLLEHFQLTDVVPVPADLAAFPLDPTAFVPRGFWWSGPSGYAGSDRAKASSLLRTQPAMVPTYPVGLPVLFCFALWALPAAAAVPFVILFHLLSGIVLTYVLARQLALPQRWAFAAAAFIALCPIYLFMGLQPMSDVPALAWVTASVVLALAVRQSPHRTAAAVFCGVTTAVAILIRPSNVIAVPAILLALPFSPRVGLRWMLGGLPFGVAQAGYNQKLYGHPFLTGYGSAGGLFSSEWLLPTARHYLYWLPVLLTPAVAAILFLPFLSRIAAHTRWLVGLWCASFLLFYATYSCTHETWWYLRFLLPAVPPLIVGTLLALHRPGNLWLGSAAAICIASWLLVEDGRLHVLDSGSGNRVYADSSHWLAAHAPANAVVVCSYTSGALHYYSHLAFFQPGSATDAAQITTAAARTHRPLYAEFFKFDAQPLAWFSGGHWTEVHRAGDIVIWRWDSPA